MAWRGLAWRGPSQSFKRNAGVPMAMAAASAAEIPANTTVQLPPPGATTTACARTVIADGETLGLQDVVEVGSGRARVEIDPALEDAIRASAATVKGFVDTGAVVYGVTTGFGAMSGVTVLREDVSMLQVVRGGLRARAFRRQQPCTRCSAVPLCQLRSP